MGNEYLFIYDKGNIYLLSKSFTWLTLFCVYCINSENKYANALRETCSYFNDIIFNVI